MQAFFKVMAHCLRTGPYVLVAVLAAGPAASPIHSQPSTDLSNYFNNGDPAEPILRLSVAGLYINTIESIRTVESDPSAPQKDPIPCVPCDGARSFSTLFVDVSDMMAFAEDWRLEGIYLTVGTDVYWFDRSIDPTVLSEYSQAAFATVMIEDYYGITSADTELGLLFEFLKEDRSHWIRNVIAFE